MADEHKEEHGSGGEGHSGGGHGGGGHGGGHGGGSHEEHEGAPEWLISFADNVALMMGFFVILLAMNMAKPTLGGIGGKGKNPADEVNPAMKDFAIAIREAFNTPVDINSKDPNEQELVQRLKERKQQGGTTSLPAPSGRDKNADSAKTGWFVAGTIVEFPEVCDATLSEEGKRKLAEFAAMKKGEQWIIEVRGHTSVVESREGKAHAMKLALERAQAAANELVAHGLEWAQLRVVGCSDNEQRTPRANSPEEHASNQRVEVGPTPEQMRGDVYNGPATSAETSHE